VSDPALVPLGSTPITSMGQFLTLVIRFLFGYAVLFGCLLLLLRRPAWTFSVLDVVFWCALALVVVLHRLTARTEADVRQWRGAALRHITFASLLWLSCQSVQAIP
jgi:hypothetical protein